MDTQALVDVLQTSETSLGKAGQSTYGSGVVVISLLMELSIGDENIIYHCVQMWQVLVKARVIQTTLT